MALADRGFAAATGLDTARVVLLRPGAQLPRRQSAAASGYDLHACLDGGALELGTSPRRVPTGIAIAAPAGFDVQIRPRSGLASRGVLAVLGTLDADYRGELFVTLYCLPEPGRYVVEDGERIAQLVVARLAPAELELVEELDATRARGRRARLDGAPLARSGLPVRVTRRAGYCPERSRALKART